MESTSKYSKWLLNFEFWLNLVWLGEKCKAKTLLVNEIFFTLHRYCHLPVSVHSIQSKTWSSFLSALLNWRKNSNFFKLTVLQSDFMKWSYGRFQHYFDLNLTLWISGQWRSWKNSSHRGWGRLFWSKINPELYRMDRQCCSSWPVNVVPPPPLQKTKTKIYNTHFISSLKNFKSGPPITQFRIEIWKIKNNVSLTTMYIMIELDVLGGISDIDIIRYRI